MTNQDQRSITISARSNDGYDAIVRMFVDAQRFGFTLLNAALTTATDREVSIRITVLADAAADCGFIQNRFARHPSLNDVEAFENERGSCGAAADAVPSRALKGRVPVAEGAAA